MPRKEDLFMDRAADAADLLRSTIRDRAPGIDALTSLRDTSFRLLDTRHPLSGVSDHSVPRRAEAGVNRYFSGGCGAYGVAVAGDRVQRRLTETDARTRRSEWCQALYCEG